MREEAGDAGLEGREVRGGPKAPGEGKDATKYGDGKGVRPGAAWAAEVLSFGLGNGIWHLARRGRGPKSAWNQQGELKLRSGWKQWRG